MTVTKASLLRGILQVRINSALTTLHYFSWIDAIKISQYTYNCLQTSCEYDNRILCFKCFPMVIFIDYSKDTDKTFRVFFPMDHGAGRLFSHLGQHYEVTMNSLRQKWITRMFLVFGLLLKPWSKHINHRLGRLCLCQFWPPTNRGGQMRRASASRSGRSEIPKITGSRLELVALKPGQVIPMTLKLILVAS